jgi:phage repressor protein C with HTH and peptisase S24 domain
MTDVDARTALETLIRERREDYAGLSRMIGRNPAYIQQFVKRGSPRRLAEEDRRTLARYFGVAEAVLGGPAASMPAVPANKAARLGSGPVAIPRLAVRAAAGAGAANEGEAAIDDLQFPAAMLRDLGAGRPAALSLVRVEGDSMQPTLGPGDDILVDGDDGAERLREGIYVLRRDDDTVIVKRVALNPAGGIDIRSDNESGGSWTNVDPATVHVIGRVIWAGRRLR